jgi:hypothetical protein
MSMFSPGYKKSSQNGGSGGSYFSDDLTQVARLARVIIRAGSEVDAIQSIWTTTSGGTMEGAAHGGTGGTLYSFDLAPDDYIIRIDGRAGSRVDQLTFTTHLGKKFGPYGGKGGSEFVITAGGHPINGFFGRSGSRLDAIGAFSTASPPDTAATKK